jgi:hypothetical protein
MMVLEKSSKVFPAALGQMEAKKKLKTIFKPGI